MVSTLGATLKVSIPNTSQEDNPPLEDISPLVAPHLILLPMVSSISNSLLEVTRSSTSSLEAALTVSVPHAIRVYTIVPSYHPGMTSYQATQYKDALLE